jgi:excisionase family DNA binding protein
MGSSARAPADSSRPAGSPGAFGGAGPPEKLLDINEVAVALRVSKMTVYRLIRDALLPAPRVGNSFRVYQSDLDAYLSAAFRRPLGEDREPGPGESVAHPSGI